jgi:hypothetical protein
MTNGKETGEVINFLTLYSKLKDWCDDDPDAIFQLAIGDKKFKRLCIELLRAAQRLHASERRPASRASIAQGVCRRFFV